MKEHATLFKAEMVRALLREVDPKTQTRRLFTRYNSHVDGARASPALWADLNFDEAWVDSGPSPAGNPGPYLKVPRRSDAEMVHRVYATIEVGDRLWVRENGWERPERTPRQMREGADTWAPYYFDADGLSWSDAEEFKAWGFKRRPSIHMPRWASRILLDVTEVRIERLQQIDAVDAIAEGITFTDYGRRCGHKGGWTEVGDCPAPESTHPQLPGWGVEPTSHMQCMHSAPAAYASLWSQINGADSWAANPFIRAFRFARAKS